MKEEQLRYHIYRKTSAAKYGVGDIINGPVFAMKMDSLGGIILSPLGDVSGKPRYGIVIEKHSDYMVVIVLESNGGSGPLYKSSEHLDGCLGLAKYRERFLCKSRDKKKGLVVVEPGLGVLELPEGFRYKPIHGVNTRPPNTVTVCFDTRVSCIDTLPLRLINKIIALRMEATMITSIPRLPVAQIEPILNRAKRMLDQMKEQLVRKRENED
ncbi:uncharacterized protein ALTATR162_LOCUS677 [Alternaria atra]|uniref:Uncharacterized protein n=1 Tax=Alternaria atra TaxID=119953 RepID=A0A8J2HVM3_9PLEO|nr:uncharacterized protein ALTATR162_LOCUS677 [Alternaria atra]CAG5140284.1 unnamed protein product [Alternaria atra]